MIIRFLIHLVIIGAGAASGLLRYKVLPRYLKLLTWLLLITFITESVSRILMYQIGNSCPIYHFYSPAELILLLLIFRDLTGRVRLREQITGAFLVLLVFSVINSLFIQTLMELNSYVDIVKSPVAAFFAVIILWEKMNQPVRGPFLIEPDVLVLIAILWFNLSSFMFFLAYELLIREGISTYKLGVIHEISNHLYYTLFCVALLLFKPNQYVDRQG